MRSRVLTALGLAPVVLGTFFCASPFPIGALAMIAAAICLTELSTLLASSIVWFSVPLALPLAYLGALRPPLEAACLALVAACLGIASLYLAQNARWRPVAAVLGPLWFLAPLMALLALHALPQSHHLLWNLQNPILLAVVPLWGGDTAGIFVGKILGKHLLAPKLSPKKTVEGAIGNFLACIAVAVPLSIALGLSWCLGLACGVWSGIFGQLGDLFQSSLKRRAGVKDSGNLLPGHGGLLDRIDSILFTAPVVFLIIAWLSR